MSDIEQVYAGAGAADVVNANFRAVSPSALYGRRSSGSGGLSFSYYGGYLNGSSVADGAVTLAASQATIYIVAAYATGVVTSSTSNTNWNDTTNYFRIGIATTGASTITGFVDWRQAYTPGGVGGGGDVVGPASAVNNRVVFFDGTTGKLIKDSGLALSGSNTGDQTTVTGNAGTATALATSRNIDGQAFDGTANITVIAPGTNAATSKATPVNADELPLVDSAASNVLKKLTWLNLKATLLASPALTGTATAVNMTFSGLLTTLASATGGAGLNLPHGAAPTSPVNGDLWTTTGGIYARINGATVGPLAAGGGGGTPAGSTTEIQYNNAGAFGSEAAFTYDASTNTMVVDKINTAKGTDITRAGTSDIGAATGNYVHLTGTTTVTALGTVAAGATRIVKFTGAGTLTHNGTSLILPGAASITTAANDCAIFVSLGSGNWQCIAYSKANGQSVIAPTAGASLTNFTGSLNTASPNNTVNAARLLVTGGTTDVDFVLTPKGAGALLAALPDATAVNGNKRGQGAVDWQLTRVSAAAVANGNQATIGGGQDNVASGAQATIPGGYLCTASGTSAFSTGFNNISSGQYTATWGSTCSATADNSTACGQSTVADAYYSEASGLYSLVRGIVAARAHSSGKQNVNGDAQKRDFHLFVQTTSATPATALAGSGGSATATNQVNIATEGMIAFDAIVGAKKTSSSDVKGWEVTGVAKNIAGTISIVGTPTVTVLGADAGASTWTVAVAADTTNSAINFNVTGQASSTILWSLHVQTAEVVF